MESFNKVVCAFAMVISSDFRMAHAAWGSIETTTMMKTQPTLYLELFSVSKIDYAYSKNQFDDRTNRSDDITG